MAQEIADSKLIDTWSSDGLKVKPDISKIIEGWQLGEQPPHEYMNWLQNTFGSKLNHILKNGIPVWNNTTQYLAGSSVQHSGNVWLCETTNTNSEPTDANANWKRIITVKALTTVLNGYVTTTGNQTIAGVKTFSSSPIVPTPTTGTQAVNKNYADLKVDKTKVAYNVSTSSFIPNTLTSEAIIERGSNANGEYIKFADGTLICRQSSVTVSFFNAKLLTAAITYPHAFSVFPATSFSVSSATEVTNIPYNVNSNFTPGMSTVGSNISNTFIISDSWDGRTFSTDAYINGCVYMAIGRWK